jgi:hypothetical protein
MKRQLTVSAMALIAMSACTDDGTGVAPDDIAGIWTASSAVFTSVADPTVSEDAVVEGVTVTITLGADDTYTLAVTIPDEPNEDDAGMYAVSGSTLTLTPTSVEDDLETFAVARDGDSMTLTASDNEWAFGENEVEEAATLVMNLTR